MFKFKFVNLIKISLICLIVLPSAAFASAEKSYQIELIVFENLDRKQMSEEAWPLSPGQPSYHNAIYPQALQMSQWQLKDAALHLKRNGNRILYHGAWIQHIGSRNQVVPVHIKGGQSFSEGSNEIEGTLKASVSRYLHVDADLIFQKSVKVASQSGSGMFRIGGNEGDGSAQMHSFRLKQSHKMRSNELHYMDHPLFGALVLITPVNG